MSKGAPVTSRQATPGAFREADGVPEPIAATRNALRNARMAFRLAIRIIRAARMAVRIARRARMAMPG